MFSFANCLCGSNADYRYELIDCKESDPLIYNLRCLMTLPTEFKGLCLLPFLRLKDVISLDGAILNQKIRKSFHKSLVGQSVHKPINMEEFNWLTRRECLVNNFNLSSACHTGPIISTFLKSVKTITELHIDKTVHISAQVLSTMLNASQCLKVLQLPPNVVDLECWSLQSDLHLTTMKMTKNKSITDAFMVALLQRSPLLEVLDMSDCTKLTPSTLSTVAQHCPKLRELFSFYCTESSFRQSYETALRDVLTQCPQLVTLRASICSSEGFFPAAAEEPFLITNMRLYGVRIATGDMNTAIVRMAQSCPHMEILDLYEFNRNTDMSIHAIAHHMPHLQSLSLVFWGRVTASGVSAVQNACPKLTTLLLVDSVLGQGPPGSLQKLYLLCTHFSDAHLILCAQFNYNLRTLLIGLRVADANRTYLSPSAMHAAVMLLPHLVQFILCVGGLDTTPDHGCIDDSVMYAFARNCPELAELSIKHSASVTTKGFQALSRLKHLRDLNVAYCPGVDNTAVSAIAKGCVELRVASFEGCVHVTSAGVRSLARSCRYLQEVNFLHCSWIFDSAVLELIRCVPDLETVYVNGYFLTTAVTARRKVKVQNLESTV